MYPVLLKIGPFTVYSLGVFWALGALAAGWIIRLELKRYRCNPDLAATMVSAGVVGGLIGARLLLILEEWTHFIRSPWDFLWSGSGFSWYGGMLGGALAVTWIVRRNGIPWLKAADICGPASALGYGIGRIGCFLGGDGTWGKVTTVPWAMAFPKAIFGWVDPLTGIPYPPGVRVHPTPIYELIQALIVFGILWPLRKKRYRDGTIFWLYLALGGSMRFAVEFLRVNPVVGLGMTEYQWISVVLVVLGLTVILSQRITSGQGAS